MPSRASAALIAGLLVVLPASGFAAEPAAGAPADRKPEPEREEKAPSARFRDSTFGWLHQVTTQTVGLGADYQSRNPTYEWLFLFRPRYYFWDEKPSSLSLRLQAQATTELTNSDSTTDQGELVLEDTSLTLVPAFTLREDGDDRTILSFSVPRLSLPTSKASRAAGKIAEVGVTASLAQHGALRSGEPVLPRGMVTLRTGYGYQFSRATVPEDPSLDRPRMNIAGVAVTNDQLSGAALAQHKATLHVLGSADLWKDSVTLSVEGGVDPVWKHPLARDVNLDLATGPGERQLSRDQRFSVVTYFDVELSVAAIGDVLTVAVGYNNTTLQLGPDGQRRSPLWSPAARLYAGLELDLESLYRSASGSPEPRAVASAR